MKVSFKSFILRGVLVGAVLGLAACAPRPTETGINDPWEAANRRTHAFNKSLDRAVLRPLGRGLARDGSDPLMATVGNVAGNLATPGLVVNNLLQADGKGAVTNTARFLLNSTLGFAGLFDVATMAGIYEADTDFGETLHVWGASEGAYVELPVFGPSTERDALGRVVDMFTNPLSHVLDKPEKYVAPVASVTSKLADRGKYAQTVDSVLYDSADSYAQSRSTYLQNRRYELGGDVASDPYGDPYGADPYDDPYAAGDPYDDPYAQ
ncbi:phospholipid-binding lipoprotein MlaA [Pseudooceanicola nitratireducens]|jgi:phospholipid-binding lipoprotein MlaA|uniref:Phospholipid-binding lipoprotein MlaA n=1 Tax=Pseudooceanicola nitratireducens TaxID=517719 RepID=A0A1I1I6X9_9RHOB|nr:VacJ family lipoprotein [Pseudooceanicola nitratireducens]SEJ19395.1 phospholipid-binding lipoprotein MlaA [Pseudooceanicola nitratireducens]SFC31572.1 phospholipid-binding lipoprotein MlaA [Pseudooceanicola nitratireducens]